MKSFDQNEFSETRREARTRRPAAPQPKRLERQSQEVLAALRRIIRATDIHSKKLSRETGLTAPQVIALRAVLDLGEVTTKSLSEHISLSQSTVTLILDRLERRQLIERYRSRSDRRIVHAKLTVAGKRILQETPPLLQERFTERFAKLPMTRREELIGALADIAEMMDADEIDASPFLAVGSATDSA